MSTDYYGLAVGLMCASAQETIFDRELRNVVLRETMRATFTPQEHAECAAADARLVASIKRFQGNVMTKHTQGEMHALKQGTEIQSFEGSHELAITMPDGVIVNIASLFDGAFSDSRPDLDADPEYTLSSEEAYANARRLAACWNACDGISIDGLESAGFGGLKHIAEATFEQRMDRNQIEQERDTAMDERIAAGARITELEIENRKMGILYGEEFNRNNELVTQIATALQQRDEERSKHEACVTINERMLSDNRILVEQRDELLELLVESQSSIGGDWRQRRDAAIAKVRP